MAPRAAPTRSDPTARQFLDAAAHLIDTAFVDPAIRTRHPADRLHFPPAIEWLRIQDVIELAQKNDGTGVSAKAFHNRWPDKDSFIIDAVVHALLYRDGLSANPNLALRNLSRLAETGVPSDTIRAFCQQFFLAMAADPRTFLLLHLAPSLALYEDLRIAVSDSMAGSRELWRQTYGELFARLNLTFRAGWSVARFDSTLQAMLDGFLLRSRLQTAQEADVPDEATQFADAVVAFAVGVLVDGEDATSEQSLNRIVSKQT